MPVHDELLASGGTLVGERFNQGEFRTFDTVENVQIGDG